MRRPLGRLLKRRPVPAIVEQDEVPIGNVVEDRSRLDSRAAAGRCRRMTAARQVPIGWRFGWWPYRFSLLSLMGYSAYFGIAAVIFSVLALAISPSSPIRPAV